MTYRIVNCRWQTGERYRMLVDAQTGMPAYWPTLFVTTQLRNAGRSVATMEAVLGAIRVLLSFAEGRNIDLTERVLKHEFLATHELDALCDDAQQNAQSKRVVSPGHHYKRLSAIASYLEWFAHVVLDNRKTPDDTTAINDMARKVRSRRPIWNTKHSIADRALTDEAFARLMEVIKPGHPDNPVGDERAAVRNQAAVLLLARLGLRKGELLGIQVPDIAWNIQELAIHRRADDDHDPRMRQPRAKTLARTLTLFPELIEHLQHYVMGARRQTRGANTHRYLLVVHRKGTQEGKPLSESGLDKVFKTLRDCDPLLANLHPHALRHYWNWQFSCAMDEKPEPKRFPKEDQEAMRSYQMGWQEGSGTAAAYNRRFIERQAQEAAIALAEKATRRTAE